MAVLLVVSAASGTVAAAGDTTVSVTAADATLAPGETTTVTIVVDNADGGVATAQFAAALTDPSVATITDVDFGTNPLLSEDPIFAADGSSVQVGYTLDDTADTGAVTVATVTIEATAAGTTDIVLQDPPDIANGLLTFGDESGTAYTITSLGSDTITVESATAPGETSVSVTAADATLAPGETTTVEVVVDDADGGVATAQFAVTLTDPSVATITDVDFGTNPLLSEDPIFAADGSSVQVGYTLDDTADTGPVTVATVTIEATADGTTDIVLQDPPDIANGLLTFGDESGTAYIITSLGSDTITVETLNTPPVADAGADQTVDEQSAVTLDGTGSSDGDGDTLSYEWTQTAGPTVALDDPTVAQPTFTAPDVSAATVLTFELTVDDGTATDSDLVDVTVQPVIPELFEIVALSAPSTATQGDLIDVSADVTNTGDETATKTVEFRIDTDGDTLISDETALATQDVEIAAGATETVTFSGIDTSGLAPGTYTHGVVTPDDSATAIITIEAPPTPAFFEVTNLQAPSGVTAGDLIDVSADVTNTGDETATQTVEFRLDLDNSGTLEADEVLTSTPVELAGGESQTVSFTDLDTTGLSGEYLHGIFTDDDSATATITVSEPVPEAFEVTNLQAPATATAGDLIDVSADVTNTGDESATKTVEFRLDVDQSGTLDADEALDSVSLTLASGETQPVTFTGIDTTGLSGEYLHGVVSPDTAATATITVSEPVPATFEVSNLQAPATVTQGDVIDVSADVTNTGDESATKTVEFRLDLDDDASIDDETAFLSEDVTLAPGETQTVTFSGIDTASLVADTYVHGVVTPDDVATATLTVEEPATERTIRIVGEGPRIGYEIVVDDTFTGGEGLQSSDSISADGTTATGFVSTGSDEYTFVGSVTSIQLDGPAMVYIDGELVDPADFGDEHVITIVGEGPRIGYEVVVDDTFTGGEGLQSSDSISADGTTATGFVSTGSDEYTFVGNVESILLDGPAMVYIDGELVDPADFGDEHVITLIGDGTPGSYEFVVGGEITGGVGLQNSDEFEGRLASGFVSGGSDEYTYTGDLQAIDVTPGVTVLVDGVEVDPSTFADVHQISFVGDGVRSDYEFTIDGEIVGGDGLAGSDTFTSASGSGSVWGATDTYYYVGALEPISVTVDGGATVLVDGTEYTGTVASLATPTGLVVVFG
jgi:hypothetical protein